jgi:hypothetical protein
MLQASLGLELDPEADEIRLRSPHLPPFLQEVSISNLRVGQSSVDLAIHREPDGRVSLRVSRRSGNVRVSLV